MRVEDTGIPGVKLVHALHRADERGSFTKVFHAATFAEHGMSTGFREGYHSVSSLGVLRGLHLQVPPADHDKLVTCVRGRALDAVVDLRRGSPTFGQHATFPLDSAAPASVYIPAGVAHGFLSRSSGAMLSYLVTTEHAPEQDTGVRWDSAGIDWGANEPIVSERDAALPPLADFDSPFGFRP